MQEKKNNSIGIVSFIFGIISILLGAGAFLLAKCCPDINSSLLGKMEIGSVIVAVIGAIFSIAGLAQRNAKKGWSAFGLVLSIIAIAIFVFVLVVGIELVGGLV